MTEGQLPIETVLQVIQAVGATLAVVVPLVVVEVRRRGRLARARHLIDVLDAREALAARLGIAADAQAAHSTGVEVIEDLEMEFSKLREVKTGLGGFYAAASAEVFLFALSIFRFRAGSGIPFLEGVLEHPGLRFGLTVVMVTLAAGGTLYIAGLVETRVRRIPGKGLALFMVFNTLFVVLGVGVSLLLTFLDPYTNAF